MSRRKYEILTLMLLFTFPTLAVSQIDTDKFANSLISKKCSLEIEKLKLCTDFSKIVIAAGESVSLNLSWANLSNAERNINALDYFVVINDEKGEKLLTTSQQKQVEMQKQLRIVDATSTVDESTEEVVLTVVSRTYNPGISVAERQTRTDQLKLSEKYGYDLSAKGKYKVSISKTVPCLEQGKTIEFVLDNIEIEVK